MSYLTFVHLTSAHLTLFDVCRPNSLDATAQPSSFFAGTTSMARHPDIHFTGTSDEAPLSFTKNTRNLAGWVALAFFETTWTSSGDS